MSGHHYSKGSKGAPRNPSVHWVVSVLLSSRGSLEVAITRSITLSMFPCEQFSVWPQEALQSGEAAVC